jgi:3-methyladenine DNA glycosylase/8-oxoguanine DNA glycosylase
MVTDQIEIGTPRGFNFWRTVHSHGWCALPPFAVDKENNSLSRVLELDEGQLVQCVIQDRQQGIHVVIRSRNRLGRRQRDQIRKQLADCLRLHDDLSQFYAEAKRYPKYRWIPKQGAGRLLRAPSVFEDVVKMICTTNCSWALTENMVGNLTSLLGKSLGNGLDSFPSPAALAGMSEAFVRKNIRAGYRSPYLLKLATDVADGKLDLESWRSSTVPTEDLFEVVKSVKGMGDYAAGNILKLLGRYDYLGLDSWVRAQFFKLHSRGRRVRDSTIERHYRPYVKWKGLFFWLEMTRQWYDQKFPF